MRGKVANYTVRWQLLRITPAYAGKSGAPCTLYRWIEDHPRLCGEKCNFSTHASNLVGSPPPMRGKVLSLSPRIIIPGITPAYAGKRRITGNQNAGVWDHPRLCGEKTKKIPKQRYFFHQSASFSFSLQYT